MEIKEPGKYRLYKEWGRNPPGTIIEITQIDDKWHKVTGPGFGGWEHWEIPAGPVEKVEASERESEPYHIELDNNGCPHCRRGKTWFVVGPDGVAGGTSYTIEEDALEIADMLNLAYYEGQSNPIEEGTS